MNTDAVTREHALSAIDECDQLGDTVFLRRYGFGRAPDHPLWHRGRTYQSRAILGVAMQFATGKAARSQELGGGRDGAAEVLADLDFEIVTIPDQPAGEESWREAAEVGQDESREIWAGAARDALLETAARYHHVVSTKELSTLVQIRTGVRTAQQSHYWIGDVLGRVAAGCHKRGEPLLAALCVNANGNVVSAYAAMVESLRGETLADADDHAAEERLACHRHFGAELPDDGGSAALTPGVVDARARKRASKPPLVAARICPTCNMALLPTGSCDNCD
ncbi:MAG: hypothetical protein WKF79_10650 [Nocardioides sp.]